MEKEQRTRLQKATQDARRLLEEEFRSQLLQTYDIDVEKVRWAEEPGAHLLVEQRLIREKLIAWIEHKEAQINDRNEALLLALREMAFTALNRFVALKLMEARELVRPCVSGGLESAGFLEFTAVAQGLLADQESSYRLYLETIFEDVSRELRALFDPRDPASLLWPKRAALLELLDILNRSELSELWSEDETLGWVYQYFNGDAERKKMREASAAPRNSRELAVRNQFFTPRYVVEFLTDNTLGRIWYEMRQGDTGLKERCRYLVRRPNEIWLQPGEEAPAEVVADEGLSQEELLMQPVHIPNRPLKDPREIRMLDPACGSMHFGLYAFDLYLAIYEEAWEIAQGSGEQTKQGEAFTAFVAYAAGFADKATFLREVPGLILLHNIHGVDIDPRATQIARLTLWLRAQRAWQEQRVEVAARPPITRSNVVCAEPMPGERELLADFVDQQFPEAERGLVQQLLETIFDKMQLAGEAGSLLKIEEEIRDAIQQARREWQKLEIQQRDLFSTAELAALGEVGSSLNTDLQNLTKDFWVTVEERIYDALREYANQAESGGYQRRLFAEDAAQGFAFIDICRKRYDVALMNPPFGAGPQHLINFNKLSYPLGKSDLYSCFVERAIGLGGEEVRVGILSSRTCLFLSSLEEWRKRYLLGAYRLDLVADLGLGVLDDALVEAAAYVLSSSTVDLTHAISCLAAYDKESRLLSAIRSRDIFSNYLKWFLGLPLCSIAYWVGIGVSRLFEELSSLDPKFGCARVGLQTSDDFRFMRLFWEVPNESLQDKWIPAAKGGEYQLFYDDIHLALNWESDAKEMKAFALSHAEATGSARGNGPLRDFDFYFKRGLTYPGRTTSDFSPRILPGGCITGTKGPGIHIDNDESSYFVLGWLATRFVRELLEVSIGLGDAVESGSAARDYNIGTIGRLPVPELSETDRRAVVEHVSSIVQRSMEYWAEVEPSRLFLAPTRPVAASLSEMAEILANENEQRSLLILDSHYATENLFSSALPFEQSVRSDVERDIGIHPSSLGESPQLSEDDIAGCYQKTLESLVNDAAERLGFSRQVTKKTFFADRRLELIALLGNCNPRVVSSIRRAKRVLPSGFLDNFAKAFLSHQVGIAFGRWDIKYSMHDYSFGYVNPFSDLKVCSPGQLQNGDGLPAGQKDVPSGYPVLIPWDGILVDDLNQPLDIVLRVQQVIQISWRTRNSMPNAEGVEHEACNILKVQSLRDYFRRPVGFFADHLRRYSKSRRQAPIYWQLSAGNGSYSAWLYYHRFTQDTLYLVLRDFVEPRIQEAEREQFELESQIGLSGDAASRLHEVQALLQDLRLFKSELELVAPLWNPNLNDGVIINHAILWRITPYTPWQKKCKECWDKLVKGDYDWAHLAFQLWPERVIRSCTTDRSLAIAHGLEERLWQETNNGTWLPMQLTEADLQVLITEHSKPAVKNALERFLAAPPPVAPTRTRASRSTSSSGSSAPRRPRGTAAVVDAEATRQVLLALTAAPSDGLAKAAIADLIGVEANALTAVIKQLKDSGQIDQLGERRGARYVLSEQGRAAVASEIEVEV